MRLFHHLALSATLLAAAPAHADAPTPDDAETSPPAETQAPIRLDTIVVTGSRTPTPLADTPVTVTVITQEQLVESQARSAADAVSHATGLVITRSFRGAGAELQGLAAHHVLILLDGQRVSGKVEEEIDLTRYPAESIERIEIVTGAGSALYGSDAMAGVINIITKKARRRPDVAVELLAGTEGRGELTATSAFRTGALGTALSLGFRRQDAFRRDPDAVATTGSSNEDLSGRVRFDLKVSDALRIDAQVAHLRREQRGLDAALLPPGADGSVRYRRIERTQRTDQLDLRLSPTLTLGDHTLTLAVSGSQTWSGLIEDQLGGTAFDRRQDTYEAVVGTTLQWSARLGAHTPTAGIEANFEHLDSDRLAAGVANRTRLGAFAQDEWRLIEPGEDPLALTLVPSVRLDHDTQFGLAVTPRLAFRFDPLQRLTLRFAFGLGYRAPGFRELYMIFENPSIGYRVAGNPDLRPERSRSYDLTAEYRPLDELTLTATAFRHDLTNLILTLPPTQLPGEPTLYTYGNIASATSQGVELKASSLPIPELRLDAGWSYTDSRDDTTGLRVSGRATHQINAQVSFRPLIAGRRLTAAAQLRALAPRPFEFAALGLGSDRRIAPWLVMLDLRVAYDLTSHLELALGAENLLNAGDVAFAPLRPRNLYLALSGRL